MSIVGYRDQFASDSPLVSFEFSDALGAVTFATGIPNPITFTNREIFVTINEIDITETEIYKSQSGKAFSGVKPNPKAYKITFNMKFDRTFGAVRELLTAIRSEYNCKFKLLRGDLLYDGALDTFLDYAPATFDKAVIEISQQEYRQNKRGLGLVANVPVNIVVYESIQQALPVKSDEVEQDEGNGVPVIMNVQGLEVLQIITLQNFNARASAGSRGLANRISGHGTITATATGEGNS